MASPTTDDDSVFELDDAVDGAGETLVLTDLQAAQICDVFSSATTSAATSSTTFATTCKTGAFGSANHSDATASSTTPPIAC